MTVTFAGLLLLIEVLKRAKQQRFVGPIVGHIALASAVLLVYRAACVGDGWEYGLVAGDDMRLYFDAARELHEVGSWPRPHVAVFALWNYLCVFWSGLSIDSALWLMIWLNTFFGCLAVLNVRTILGHMRAPWWLATFLPIWLLISPVLVLTEVRNLKDALVFFLTTQIIVRIAQQSRPRYVDWLAFALLAALRWYQAVFCLVTYLVFRWDARVTVLGLLAAVPLAVRSGMNWLNVEGYGWLAGMVRFFVVPTVVGRTRAVMSMERAVSRLDTFNTISYYLYSLWWLSAVLLVLGALALTVLRMKGWSRPVLAGMAWLLGLALIYSLAYGGANEVRHKLAIILPLTLVVGSSYQAKDQIIVMALTIMILLCAVAAIGLGGFFG